MEKITASVIVLSGLLLAAGCASSARITAPVTTAAIGEIRPGLLNGYLQPAELPDSLALLPAPPAAGSAAQAADDAAYHELNKLLGTARGALAVTDADLSPRATGVFACALGVPISEAETPNLNMLLRRTLTDAALATYKAKTRYRRTRPFVAFKAPSCTPADEAFLVNDGSYPSGHTAIGWTWALMLTQVALSRPMLSSSADAPSARVGRSVERTGRATSWPAEQSAPRRSPGCRTMPCSARSWRQRVPRLHVSAAPTQPRRVTARQRRQRLPLPVHWHPSYG